jgi:hypothetical protein
MALPENPGVVRAPDDVRSVADSLSSMKVPPGPPNPGIVRSRGPGILSRLPPNSDAFEVFANMRRDGNISDEEAFMKFITTYDVSISTMNQIASNVYPTPTSLHTLFSHVTNKS